MFGSEYAQYPHILTDSFGKMKEDYENKVDSSLTKGMKVKLISWYISFLGIPEIGFQVRSLHFKKALQMLKIPPKNILDAGSGIGVYAFYLHALFPRAKVEGTDIDEDKIQFCKRFAKEIGNKNIDFRYKNIAPPHQGRKRYDLIVNIDVLEHIRQYKQVLKNFSLLLHPGGYLFIHTPHRDQKRIFKISEHWHHEDHVREGFLKDELIKEVEKTGLKIVVAYQSFGIFGRFAWEINHIALSKNFIFAGLLYPFLYPLALLDTIFTDASGWGIVLLAQKPKK